MNAAVTGAMDHVATNPIPNEGTAIIVIAVLILCFIVREVLRVAGERYQTVAQDLVVMLVPLFIAGSLILLIQVFAISQG